MRAIDNWDDEATAVSSENIEAFLTDKESKPPNDKNEHDFHDQNLQFESRIGVEDGYSDYTAALQLLPTFQPYSYSTDTVADQQEVGSDIAISLGQNAIDSVGSVKAELDTGVGRPSHVRGETRVPLPVSAFDLELRLLRGLRQIMHFRDKLLSAQLRVEDTNRQVASIRASIDTETSRIIRLSRNPAASNELLRDDLARAGLVLEQLSKTRTEDEIALADEQRQVTLQQSYLKSAINSLYGEFTDGAQIGESDFEMEDEMLANKGSHMSSGAQDTIIRGDHEEASLQTVPEDQDIQALDSDSLATFDDASQIMTQKAHTYTATPKDGTIRKSNRAERSRRKDLNSHDILECGSQYTDSLDELRLADISAAHLPLLQTTITMIDTRKKDLKPELLTSLILNNSDEKENQSLLRRGIQQKFRDIDAPGFHVYDSIAMWGSSMSQNALTELMRTALFTPNSVAKGLYDRVGVDRWDQKPLSALIIALTDVLRELDIPTLEIKIARRVPESLRVHYAADGSTTARKESQEQVPRIASQDTIATSVEQDGTATPPKTVPSPSPSPDESIVLVPPNSGTPQTETSLQTSKLSGHPFIQVQRLVHRSRSHSLDLPPEHEPQQSISSRSN